MASTHAHARSAWSGKWAFILAAAASAVGLGNNVALPLSGGQVRRRHVPAHLPGAGVHVRVSLLLLETALGRKTGQSAIGAFKQFGKKYAFIGILRPPCPSSSRRTTASSAAG